MSYLINMDARKEIAQGLGVILADSTVLYFKTHVFHWNVEGAHFYSYHQLLEEQYKDHWSALDEIAERIRALGFKAPHSLSILMGMSRLKEATANLSEKQMLEMLRDDSVALSQFMLNLSEVADSHKDRATTDMLTVRAAQLEKNAWMLNSSIA